MLYSRSKKHPASLRFAQRSNRPQVEFLEDRTLMTAGALDPTFGTGGIARVGLSGGGFSKAFAATAQSDGKLVVVGGASPTAVTVGQQWADFAVARYNVDGSLDTS